MLCILVFVSLYARHQSQADFDAKVVSFQNMTTAMEQVTENYLEGEQRICDVWARYISSKNMTIEEAVSFIRISHVSQKASAHIVFLDSLSGLSTRARQNSADDYTVSYERIDLLNDVSWISDIGDSINISRAYTNPVNGEQSIAFCNFISLCDPETGEAKDALLLRVLPISELGQKWVFPQEGFEDVELSMIDADGDYIIKGHSFKNSSFFEFYRSYNATDPSSTLKLFKTITSSTGSIVMNNSRGEECVLSYTPLTKTEGWTLLGFVPMDNLKVNSENWMLIGFVSAGLLILFIFDLTVMLYFNRRLQATAEEAASANKAKTDFLSTMSHDIRTPLHIILGCVDMAETYHADENMLLRYLESIRVSGEYLLRVLDRVLEAGGEDRKMLTAADFPANASELGEFLKKDLPLRSGLKRFYDFSGKRVLVAEDMELNREIAGEVLKQTKARVEFAEDGEACLKMLEEKPAGYYDLILMDILMPKMDGLETTKRIRKLPDRTKAAIPIIAMTANVFEKDRNDAFAAGMDAFAEKPISTDKLFETMKKYLG